MVLGSTHASLANMGYLRDIYKGKTMGRMLLNQAVRPHLKELKGLVLDLAGNHRASYNQFFTSDAQVTSGNVSPDGGVDVVADINAKLPFADRSFDAVVFLNALYIAEDTRATLLEIRRVLKDGGVLVLSSPFIANEMPEPHDYRRFTAEGLERELRGAGFTSVRIERVGERFSAVAHILHSFYFFNTIRLLAFSCALFMDRLIPAKIQRLHPMPIGYLVSAR